MLTLDIIDNTPICGNTPIGRFQLVRCYSSNPYEWRVWATASGTKNIVLIGYVRFDPDTHRYAIRTWMGEKWYMTQYGHLSDGVETLQFIRVMDELHVNCVADLVHHAHRFEPCDHGRKAATMISGVRTERGRAGRPVVEHVTRYDVR